MIHSTYYDVEERTNIL